MTDLLWWCLRYFASLDESNAAIHTASVRYSPITFRLAEALTFTDRGGSERPTHAPSDAAAALWQRVYDAAGTYEEDQGR